MALGARLRARREAVLAKAERDRHERTINPDGWSYKVYRRWEERYSYYRSIEDLNFCNYWRAVFFWAPARWVQRKVLAIPFAPIIAGVFVLALLGIVVWAFIWQTVAALAVLAGIVAVIYAWLCIYLGWTIVNWFGKDVKLWHLPRDHDHLPTWLKVVYFVVCGLPAIPVALVIGVFVGLFALGLFLFDDLGVHEMVGHGIAKGVVGTVKGLNARNRHIPWLRPWLGLIPLAAWLFFQYGTSSFWWTVLWVALWAIPLAFVLAISLTFLFNRIDQAVRQSEVRTMTQLFSTPGFMEWFWAGDEDDLFCDARANRRYLPLTHQSTAADFAQVMTWEMAIELLKNYLRTRPEFRTTAMPRELRPRRPRRVRLRRTKAVLGRVGWLLTGLGEFLALLWSGLVYIKRVGACPRYKVGVSASPQHSD